MPHIHTIIYIALDADTIICIELNVFGCFLGCNPQSKHTLFEITLKSNVFLLFSALFCKQFPLSLFLMNFGF